MSDMKCQVKRVRVEEKRNFSKFHHPYERIIIEGGIYHIIQRASGKDILFVEDKDFLYFIYLLKEIKERFSLDIFCFSLMPNHIHLLLRINKSNLSEAMKSLFEKYAIYFNNKYQRKGHLFYGKYRAFLCQSDEYLITASVYIHLNPYKAGLVNTPEEYRWSSLAVYLNPPRKTFLNYSYILNFLSSDIKRSSFLYRKMLNSVGKLKFKNIYEDYKFIEKLLLSVKEKFERLGIFKKSNICEWERLFQRFKNRKKLRKIEERSARKYLIEQLRARGYSIKEIVQMLNVSRQAIYDDLNL